MELVYSVGRRGSGWDTAGQGGRRGGRATDARSSAWSVPRGLSQSRASWCCCGYDCVAAVEDTVEWDTTAVEGDGEEPATGDAGSVLVFDVDAPGEMARLCSPASLTPESVAWEPPRRPEYGVRWQMAADGTWQGQVLEEEEDGEHRMASRGSAARLPALLVLYSMSVWRVWVPRTPGFCSNRWEVLFTEECPETLLCVHWIGLPGNAPAGVCALTSSGALVLWWPTQIAGAEWDAEGTAADERAIPSARERQQSWMSPSAFTYRRCAQVQLADDAVIRYASMHSLSARHCWRRHRLHERQQQRRVAAAVGERIATRDAADGLPAGVCTALRIAYVNASSLDRVRVHDVLVVALQVPVDEESGKDANLRDKDIALVPFEAGEVVLQPAESERSAANGNGCGGREATPSTAAARVDDIVLGAEGQALYIAHQRATALSLHWDGDEAVDDGEQMPDAATGNGHGGGHAVDVLQRWRWCGTLHSDTAFTALAAMPAPQPRLVAALQDGTLRSVELEHFTGGHPPSPSMTSPPSLSRGSSPSADIVTGVAVSPHGVCVLTTLATPSPLLCRLYRLAAPRLGSADIAIALRRLAAAGAVLNQGAFDIVLRIRSEPSLFKDVWTELERRQSPRSCFIVLLFCHVLLVPLFMSMNVIPLPVRRVESVCGGPAAAYRLFTAPATASLSTAEKLQRMRELLAPRMQRLSETNVEHVVHAAFWILALGAAWIRHACVAASLVMRADEMPPFWTALRRQDVTGRQTAVSDAARPADGQPVASEAIRDGGGSDLRHRPDRSADFVRASSYLAHDRRYSPLLGVSAVAAAAVLAGATAVNPEAVARCRAMRVGFEVDDATRIAEAVVDLAAVFKGVEGAGGTATTTPASLSGEHVAHATTIADDHPPPPPSHSSSPSAAAAAAAAGQPRSVRKARLYACMRQHEGLARLLIANPQYALDVLEHQAGVRGGARAGFLLSTTPYRQHTGEHPFDILRCEPLPVQQPLRRCSRTGLCTTAAITAEDAAAPPATGSNRSGMTGWARASPFGGLWQRLPPPPPPPPPPPQEASATTPPPDGAATVFRPDPERSPSASDHRSVEPVDRPAAPIDVHVAAGPAPTIWVGELLLRGPTEAHHTHSIPLRAVSAAARGRQPLRDVHRWPRTLACVPSAICRIDDIQAQLQDPRCQWYARFAAIGTETEQRRLSQFVSTLSRQRMAYRVPLEGGGGGHVFLWGAVSALLGAMLIDE